MLSPIVIDTIVYAGMLIILCVGFSLIHMIEKFPNFAHASYTLIGTIFTFSMVQLWGYNPYVFAPLSSVVGGALGITLYLLVVRPMKERGRGGIEITFAMFALSFILSSLANVYSFWVLKSQGYSAIGFLLRGHDFGFMDHPGILFVAPLVSVILVSSLHLLLTRTKFGIAIRASAEDPKLAVAMGINIFRVHLFSWFLAGAMSALAGALFPLWIPNRTPNSRASDALLISVIAGSVVGGLDSVYGAIFGGLVVTLAERVLPGLLISYSGMWIAGYESLVPGILIVIMLMVEPRGISGILGEEHPRFNRLRRYLYRSSSDGQRSPL